jgi:hypothetical protein
MTIALSVFIGWILGLLSARLIADGAMRSELGREHFFNKLLEHATFEDACHWERRLFRRTNGDRRRTEPRSE